MTRKQKSMFPVSFTVLFIAFLLVFADGARGGEQAGNINSPGKAVIHHSASDKLKSISIPFIENKGQVDDRVAYYAPISAGTVYVTRKGELVYKLHGTAENLPHGWVLTETLVGAAPVPRGVRQTPTRVSSFKGSDTKQWRKELRTYDEILLGDVYPNVNVSLTAHDATVEKIFTVRPGGSPDSIRLHLSGQEDLEIVPDGALMAKTGLGPVLFSRPVAWQNKGKQRIEVDVQWHIADNGEYGYQVAQYDPAITLYIDPVIQATYLGGSGDELEGGIIGVDAGGDVFIGGSTSSFDFPGTAGGAQSEFGGLNSFLGDIYIARLSGDLTTLVQVTYLGGSGDDSGPVVLSVAGTEFYIFGTTRSPDFPGTAGGAQSVFGGGGVLGSDGFVAMLSTDLTTLHQATYYGGSGDEIGAALSFGPDNQLYFTGSTASTDLPGTAGGAQATHGGGDVDIFVVSLSSDLTTLNQATYFGGSGDERTELPPDPAGDSNGFYLVGSTDSTDLPGTAGGLQPVFAGTDIRLSGFGGDGFIALLSDDLTAITQATYLGGSKYDSTFSIRDAGSGSKYVVGTTTSEDMPGTAGGAQTAYGGGGFPSGDGYIALVSSDLRTLVQATYLGGSGNDFIALAGKLNGSIVFYGATDSADFPGTAGGAQPNYGGFGDGFVAMLSTDLTTLHQATYYGGSGEDDGGVALLSNGDIYLGGVTSSTDLPGTTGGIQPVFGGGDNDAFIARFSPDLTTLHQATYYGGNGDNNLCFHPDLNGNLPEANNGFYFAGSTDSTNLPGVAGGAQDTLAGGSFVGTDDYIVLMSLDLLGDGGEGGNPAPKSADLVIDFGSIGLWARMNDASWQKLNNSSPDRMVVGDVDGNGVDDVIADFGSTFGGIFIKRNGGGWSKLHNFSPELMMIGDLDNNGQDDVVIDFGGIGLWARMNDSSWLKLNNASPAQLVVGDMDGNGADDVVAVFSSGIFVKRNLAGWSQLHNFIPEAMAVGDLDGSGKDDIVIDFGGIALWARMNDSSWSKLHNSSPGLIATGDLDGNGSDDVIATFSGSGLWQKLNLGGWGQLNPNAPDEVITADVDGSGQDDIIANFGSTIGGIFIKRNQGSWNKLHNFNPDSLAVGNLDGN